jgi:hypothetical protein
MTLRGDDIGPVLAALADPTRRRVLDAVASRGEATATMIAAELPVSRQAGREMLYTARLEPLTDAARWMDAVAAEWDARLARIKRLAELPVPNETPRQGPATVPKG